MLTSQLVNLHSINEMNLRNYLALDTMCPQLEVCICNI